MKRIVTLTIFLLIFCSIAFAANITDKNPMILDETGVITTEMKYITQAIWHQCSTDGQLLIVRNEDGGHVTGRAECVEGVSVKVWYYEVCLNGIHLTIPSCELHMIVNERRSSFKRCKKHEIPILPQKKINTSQMVSGFS